MTTPATPLSVVRDPFAKPGEPTDPSEVDVSTPAHIPNFEGLPVAGTKAKITSLGTLEIDDQVLKMDQMVTMLVQVRVVNISFPVDEKSGKLHRVHTVKAVDATLIPQDFEILKHELT